MSYSKIKFQIWFYVKLMFNLILVFVQNVKMQLHWFNLSVIYIFLIILLIIDDNN